MQLCILFQGKTRRSLSGSSTFSGLRISTRTPSSSCASTTRTRSSTCSSITTSSKQGCRSCLQHKLKHNFRNNVLQSLCRKNRVVGVAVKPKNIMLFNDYVTSSKQGCRSCLQTKNILIIFFETVLLGKIKCRISQQCKSCFGFASIN